MTDASSPDVAAPFLAALEARLPTSASVPAASVPLVGAADATHTAELLEQGRVSVTRSKPPENFRNFRDTTPQAPSSDLTAVKSPMTR